MDRFTAYYFLIGMSVFVFSQTVFLLLQRPIAYRIDLNRRMKMMLVRSDRDRVMIDLLKARGLSSDGKLRFPIFRKINVLILQSGLTIGIGSLIGIVVLISIVSILTLKFYLDFDFAVSFVLGAIAGMLFPVLFLLKARRGRQKKFAAQLPEAMDVITRSLRAGHPLPIALGLVARETADPLGSEFGILSDEISYGSQLSAALHNLQSRVGLEELSILATAIEIQSETGGNLMELLSNLSSLMREREKMRRKVLTLSSEGRFSGNALSALPFLFFAALNVVAPSFYGDIWGNPLTKYVLASACCWMLVGIFVIRRMVNFEF